MTQKEHDKILNSIPWMAGGFVTITSIILSILRFLTCSNTNFDLAFYTRIVWGMTYSDRFNTLIGAHDLGLHLSPVLHLFVPFALFLPIAPVLLISQAVALGMCIPCIAKIALRKTGNVIISVIFAIAFALYPTIIQTGSTEFHPTTLSLPFLFLSFNSLDEGKFLKGIVFLVPAILCREDVALVAAGAGIVTLLHKQKNNVAAVSIAIMPLLYFCIYIFLIQPNFLPPSGSYETHFPEMGHNMKEIIINALSHPQELFIRISSVKKLTYLLHALLPVFFTSLLSPLWLITSLPPAIINLFSSFPPTCEINSHYSILLIPGIFLSAIDGVKKATSLVTKSPDQNKNNFGQKVVMWIPVITILLGASFSQYKYGGLPGARNFNIHNYLFGRNNGILCWYAKEIKKHKELSVVAPYGALAHLADRKKIYSIDFIHPHPDVAICDISQRRWIQLEIKRWFDPWEIEYEKLMSNQEYIVWKSNPPYEMLWKRANETQRKSGPPLTISVNKIPETAQIQNIRWNDYISLEAVEAGLRIINENWTGNYEKLIVVQITFYWKAIRKIKKDLFVQLNLTGRGKTLTYFFRPVWGIRKTGNWRTDEIIKDEQMFVSPGGWPLREITAEVRFVKEDGSPFPEGAEMKKIVWSQIDANRDRYR